KTLCKRIDNTNRMITEMVDNDESLRTLLDDRQASYKKESTGDTSSVAGTEFEDPAGSHAIPSAQTTMNFCISPDFCVRIEGGEHVFHQGDPGDCMFIILEGSLEISTGSGIERHILAHLGPGEFFGETAIITDQPRTADAVAADDVLLLLIKKQEFLDRIKAEPELALHLLQGLIIRLRAMLSVLANPDKSLSSILRTFQPPLKKRSRVKAAVVSLSTCGGCSAVLLESQDELLRLLDNVIISYCPMLIDAEEIGDVDIALVDGIVRVREDEEKLIEARHKSRYLISWGTCASYGGIPAQANQYELEDLLEESYGNTQDTFAYYLSGSSGIGRRTYQEQEQELRLLRRARKLDDFVKVDYYLPGCPPDTGLLNQLVGELKGGGQPAKLKPIVCAECSRKNRKMPVEYFWVSPKSDWELDLCFTSRGSVCLGFMTKGGCGAVCPQGGLPCWGCRGPSESVFKKMDEGLSFDEFMLSSLTSRHKGLEEQIRSVMKIFRKQANSSLKFNRYITNTLSRHR
ncbi:MAG TPA: cyclic nucleotide-binding domain-containing protein, partial [Thermodesulfovibrionales bacterium]|nr:cyclic nucleotide-binding domain-containing protein [Thermodesulfovibrionales bacterium]